MSQQLANRLLVALGSAAFFVPLVAWPITSLTVWRHSDQGILALSWIAIIMAGATLLLQALTKQAVES